MAKATTAKRREDKGDRSNPTPKPAKKAEPLNEPVIIREIHIINSPAKPKEKKDKECVGEETLIQHTERLLAAIDPLFSEEADNSKDRLKVLKELWGAKDEDISSAVADFCEAADLEAEVDEALEVEKGESELETPEPKDVALPKEKAEEASDEIACDDTVKGPLEIIIDPEGEFINLGEALNRLFDEIESQGPHPK